MQANTTVVTLAFGNETKNFTESSSIFVTGDVNGIIALCVAGFGMLFNLYVFIVMSVVHISMHEAAAVLLKFQLIIDAIACLFLIIAQFQIPKDQTNSVLYHIVCAAFERGMFMWYFYVASALNIVAVCIQRFVITVYPFKKVTKKHSYIICVAVLVIAIGHETYNYSLQMGVIPEKDYCLFEHDSDLATWTWCTLYYFAPTILLIVLYAKIILTVRKSSKLQSTKQAANPEAKVMKNAIAVAVLFIIFAATNAFCSILLQYKAMDTVIWESFVRRFSYVTIMINSASTPIVYIIFLNSIREKTFNTLCRCFKSPGADNSTPSISQTTGTRA